MDKTYRPGDIETKWYQAWEQGGYFAPKGTSAAAGTPYTIMIPPPNVTGSLHMGHAFQHTIMDALIRYRRMNGDNTLWQVGTDHAGIATQMVVERQLAAQGKTRHDLGRDDFIKKVWEWKAQSGGTITSQMRRLGNSVDWDTERFTMDDGFYRAVQEVFIRLYDDGLIYRGKRLVNWDPKLHTAISDLEVESHDEKGHLWHFRYPLADGATTADGNNYLVVATTRPETMLGDTAVAVNPTDERYQSLIGKFIVLPFVNRRIPIIADDYVDKEFGTGCVKITPAHDFNDYQVGQRHQLPMINIFTRDAKIVGNFDWHHQISSPNPDCAGVSDVVDMAADIGIPEYLQGLDRFDARKRIVEEIENMGLLEKIEPHALKVPRGDRSGVIIEPWLTDQWYVATKKLAEPAIAAVEDGRIQFVPKQYENMYFSWMRDLQDWCISRQLWWGHRIPAFYDAGGKVYVAATEQAARDKYTLGKDVTLTQDNDVLDTWFSSALWTFGTLGWPDNTERLQTFHPTDVLVTGFDIIFFWVARMIMMTMHFMKNEDGSSQVPFKTVYVTGLIRDEQGQKMSKSKGNVLDPLDMIDGISLPELLEKRCGGLMQPQLAEKIKKNTEKAFPEGISAHGTDALRFTLSALASTGRDINWDMKRLEGYRNFCNKIWNAARYVLSNTEEFDCGQDDSTDYELSLADRWIITKLQDAELAVQKAIDGYRFDLAAQALYEFFWNEYCDWYLELSKPVLWDQNATETLKKGTRRTLVRVLEAALRLAHPIMPFITEEIWQRVAPLAGVSGQGTGATIMLQSWPIANPDKRDDAAVADITWLQGVILAVRNVRGEMNIPPGKALPVFIKNGSLDDERRCNENRQYLMKLAKLESINFLAANDDAPMSATQLVGDMQVLVPMAGLIDKEAELKRLGKEIEKLQKDISGLDSRLSNDAFVAKAPVDVVAKQREQLAAQKNALVQLQAQAEQMRTL